MEITELKELIALAKLLKSVKFENSDLELSFFAGSPIVSNFFVKICEEIQNHASLKNNKKGKELDWGYIENQSGYVETIKERIKKNPDWNLIEIPQKIKIIEVFIHPYKCSESTINELCNINTMI